MKIIKHGNTVVKKWKSRTLRCPFCDCRFFLKNKDAKELRLIKNFETKRYCYVIRCPDCQKEFPTANIEKIPP